MSAALQLTDTHLSHMIQAQCRRSKEKIKKEMRQQRAEEKEKGINAEDGPIGFKAGPYEVLRVAFEAHEYTEQMNEEFSSVIKGMRENFMLSYRPNLRTGRMERCDTQASCLKKDEDG